MNNTEFRQWLSVHRAAFPSIIGWLERFPAVATETMPSYHEILAQWSDTLRDQKLPHCLEATARYGRGDVKPPDFPADHAREVRKLAREINLRDFKLSPLPAENYRQRRFTCKRCEDDGRVQCWHPIAMHAAKEGKFPHPRAMLHCAIRCDCAAGNRRPSFMALFNDRQWVQVVGITERDNEALLSWAAGRLEAMTWNPDEHEYPVGTLSNEDDREWFQRP